MDGGRRRGEGMNGGRGRGLGSGAGGTDGRRAGAGGTDERRAGARVGGEGKGWTAGGGAQARMDMPRGSVLIGGMRLERMRLYQAAEALTAEVDRLAPLARRIAPGPTDHLVRSADSVLFNTAEGIGCYRPKMKIAAYEIARKEASEVRAALRRLVILRVYTPAEVRKAMDLAGACIGMLTAAIIAAEKRAVREGW